MATRGLKNTEFGISTRVEETNALLQQLLTEQKRTNQLLEWLGALLKPSDGSVS